MLADLHTHTSTSHGHHSAAGMYEAAAAAGLDLFGLSEHSPLPEEYACKLYVPAFPGNFRDFVRDVQALRQRELEREDRPLPLLGVELDWLPGYPRHMGRFLSCWPFSYVIGSLHYVGLFPVARPHTWTDGREAAYARYREYYEEMARMAASGLVNVASHPDFIKRASYGLFHEWLREKGSLDVVARAVQAMTDNGVIMEVSSAGLRQPFAEPYPCPAIMGLAADFGADRHGAKGVACASCHGAKNEVAYPSIEQCSKCHNPADMEKKTKDMKPSNPHTSPHYGNQLDCVNCHVQHGETVNFCDQCHTFGFKVP